MTTATRAPSLPPTTLWSTMPGWGIAADLTPPELVNSRQLRVLRRWLAIGLIALLLVGVGGYVMAARSSSSASAGLSAAQADTARLQSQADKYSGVTRMQGTVSQVQTQIAKLMAGDVDLTRLMALLNSSLPSDMNINAEAIAISLAGAAVAATPGSAGAATSIGTVTLAGAGQTLDDLSEYVDKLRLIPGVVDVIPTSNTATKTGVTYNLTLGLTTALLSHRYDVSAKGTK